MKMSFPILAVVVALGDTLTLAAEPGGTPVAPPVQVMVPGFSARELPVDLPHVVGLKYRPDGVLVVRTVDGKVWQLRDTDGDGLEDKATQLPEGKDTTVPPARQRSNRLGDAFAADGGRLVYLRAGQPKAPDEPATFDLGPSQSVRAFAFNEPSAKGGPTFGPEWWVDDLFVLGCAPGRLFRAKLAKTEAGYVARGDLFASLAFPPSDCGVTPDGGLVVACDGPAGKAKLYRITYTDLLWKDFKLPFSSPAPQPVLAWAAGPTEVRVAFDRPLNLGVLGVWGRSLTLQAGDQIRAGERYAAPEKRAARFGLKVETLRLSPDRRTLLLNTDALVGTLRHVLTFPDLARPPFGQGWKGELHQHPRIELEFDPNGCDGTWTDRKGEIVWQGWLPSPDLHTSRRLTLGSADHDALWRMMREPGELKVKAKLDLSNIVGPGERVTVAVAGRPLPILNVGGGMVSVSGGSDSLTARVALRPEREPLVPFQARFATNGVSSVPVVAWHTEDDERPRPFPLGRILPTWIDPSVKEPQKPVTPTSDPDKGPRTGEPK